MSQSNPTFKTGRAWIEIDRENLRHNIEILRALLPESCELMPAVKANAYGHGAVLMARELNKLGIDTFCVATLQEGIELRENGIKGDILILGYTSPEEFELLSACDLMQTVIDFDYAKCLNAYGQKLKVHIKIDTGMHRLGERCERSEQILRIFKLKNLLIEGMYTQLCTADDPRQKEYMHLQIKRFFTLTDKLKRCGIALPKIHIQNSYGVLNAPDLRCDYARAGIAMYGVFSSIDDMGQYTQPLRPVLCLKARVETVKQLTQGEAVGYGLAFTACRNTKIATIAIGYADGIPRGLSCGIGSVLINGKRAPIAGRICMDQLTVDVTDVPDVKQGDIAVIIGHSEKETISACDIARQTNSISNEVLSRLGSRLQRIVI